METTIGILGDFDNTKISQVRLHASLDEAGRALSITVRTNWISSQKCSSDWPLALDGYAGIWGAPGGYHDPEGIIKALQLVRENNIPFLGT